MPNITVEILVGRTREQKQSFAENVTRAAVEHLGAKPEAVRIRFVETKHEDLFRAGKSSG